MIKCVGVGESGGKWGGMWEKGVGSWRMSWFTSSYVPAFRPCITQLPHRI